MTNLFLEAIVVGLVTGIVAIFIQTILTCFLSCYNLNKQHQKSIDLFKGAIAKVVKTIEIYNALGKTYWEIGNNVEANFYYQKALETDPSNQEAAAMVKRTSTASTSTVSVN